MPATVFLADGGSLVWSKKTKFSAASIEAVVNCDDRWVPLAADGAKGLDGELRPDAGVAEHVAARGRHLMLHAGFPEDR